MARITVLLLLTAFLVLCVPFGAFASTQASDEGFETIADTYMEKVLSEYHVAGGAVSVVKDGSVVFSKGYGYADLNDSIPVDGGTTAFQIASITKLFTATAVMQMVESGKLDLDTDINKYLREFQIKNHFSRLQSIQEFLQSDCR